MKVFLSLLTTITFCVLFFLFEMYGFLQLSEGDVASNIAYLEKAFSYFSVWKVLLIPPLIPSILMGIAFWRNYV